MQKCHEGVQKKNKHPTKKSHVVTECFILQCLMFAWTGNIRINSL